MEERPTVKTPVSWLDKLIEAGALVFIIALWCFTLYVYEKLPDIIPIHFDTAGQTNKHGRKISYIFLPVTATIIYVGVSLLNRHPDIIYFNKENSDLKYRMANRMLRFLKMSASFVFLLIAFFVYYKVTPGTNEMDRFLMPVLLAVIILPVIYYGIRLYRS